MALNGLGSLIKGLKESHAPHTFILYLSTLLFINFLRLLALEE